MPSSNTDPSFLPAHRLAAEIAARRLSPVDIVEALLSRIERHNPKLHAFIDVYADDARLAAEAADKAIRSGHSVGPLHGVPIALKDNYWTRGVRTTAGSKLLADFVPSEDGTAVAKLRAAGAVLTGKLNMHELAIGGTTTNPHYGATHNPWARTIETMR